MSSCGFLPGERVVVDPWRYDWEFGWRQPLRVGVVVAPRHHNRPADTIPVRWPGGELEMAPRGTVLGVDADLEGADHATRVLRILGADAHAELTRSGWPRELPGGWGDHGARAVAAPETAALLRARLAALAPGAGFLVRAGRPSIDREIVVSWTDGPTVAHVADLAGVYTDRYQHRPQHALLLHPDGRRELVGFQVASVRCQRTLSAGYRARLEQVVEAATGEPFTQRSYDLDYRGHVVAGFGRAVLDRMSELDGDQPPPDIPPGGRRRRPKPPVVTWPLR